MIQWNRTEGLNKDTRERTLLKTELALPWRKESFQEKTQLDIYMKLDPYLNIDIDFRRNIKLYARKRLNFYKTLLEKVSMISE